MGLSNPGPLTPVAISWPSSSPERGGVLLAYESGGQTLRAFINVPQSYYRNISVGQKVHLEVDSFKDEKFNGVVTDVANSANNNDTGSTASSSASTSTDATKFQVKIRVSEKEAFLPGMSVTANIETRSRTNALSVPIQCVTTRLPVAAAGKTNSPRGGGISTNQTAAAGKTNATAASDKTNEVAASGKTNEIAASGKSNETAVIGATNNIAATGTGVPSRQ